MPARPWLVPLAMVSLLAACKSDRAVAPPSPAATCDAGTPIPLALLSGAVVSFPGPCARLNGSGAAARYFAVAQYAVQAAAPLQTSFTVTTSADAAAAALIAAGVAEYDAADASGATTTMQTRFDASLRAREREISETVGAVRRDVSASVARQQAAVPDTIRSFSVLGSLTGNNFVTATARLRYEGRHVYVYEDTAVVDKFSDAEYTLFGKQFDDVLYPIDTAAFGSPSDIDNNGHIIVLLTPKVNALTKAADCSTQGFVAGYFFGLDLVGGSGSNRAEVFYSIAPDSAGTFSCAHPKSQVTRQTPPTFTHELQHMISFNQHVLIRGGRSEDAWLNEGLSHIAEELASLYYENKCAGVTTPPCRTNPTQLFPDSAQGFGPPQFRNAYSYLGASTQHSVTTLKGLGTLEERGATWLFLRWLGDHKGDAIFKSLVQTVKTGVANVEEKAGEPFPAMFGDFGIATYTDSINGVARSAIPVRYRFTSRNTRQIFARLFPVKPNPITPTTLSCAAAASGSMVQGTSSYYLVGGVAGCPTTRIALTMPSGMALAATLKPQVAVFRLP